METNSRLQTLFVLAQEHGPLKRHKKAFTKDKRLKPNIKHEIVEHEKALLVGYGEKGEEPNFKRSIFSSQIWESCEKFVSLTNLWR